MEIDWSEKKKEILNKLLAQKKVELRNAEISLERIKQTAIESPGRMESRYDSTKQEYSYLADDVSESIKRNSSEIKQLEELIKDCANLISDGLIGSGSIIRAALDGQSRAYMLLLFGSSEIITDEVLGGIHTVSSASPIGMLLLNRKVGDTIELNNKKIIIKEVR